MFVLVANIRFFIYPKKAMPNIFIKRVKVLLFSQAYVNCHFVKLHIRLARIAYFCPKKEMDGNTRFSLVQNLRIALISHAIQRILAQKYCC